MLEVRGDWEETYASKKVLLEIELPDAGAAFL